MRIKERYGWVSRRDYMELCDRLELAGGQYPVAFPSNAGPEWSVKTGQLGRN